ncbi:50S ribosomal protein L6 [Mesomycoplasma ovipneumoniae]|uniref:50S ribosomal protein L6 n=1 Tax=Mesomycoplasma ovipneumoniae TaxID=29562 RepID=A0AAJ2UF98_9BACT|nr:50S ribosomal protein L6 [Mesomycoplasma ovipneumoniae]MDW2906967.1 50S ribosomal protein L6 [Mesomycoplasma ovipneumoniae]MDW2907591.1 50S ribosomal protein L6 [Mesomycoplasma ovipneumoniae]MDW2908874.1 50S ribosomal protein L6 [Mesomycoplasma ovipneumoniae]MDW2910862.1 50S ribosomal protein L6 [Mesomycoplasma ovipneumoniae]MDW2911441.1 50S ribosomal protein L6 [Mesomycoplasma ovipneumoniae]
MSRVGNRVLIIPEKVSVEINGSNVKIQGPLGILERQFSDLITIIQENNTLKTIRKSEEKQVKQLHGTTNSHLSGMLTGVSKGFQKELKIKGVGYKATLKEKVIELLVGYSHPVELKVPGELDVLVPNATTIVIKGIDKQKVGQFSAQIRQVRRPNPYSGKGISYSNEILKLKEGKKASK